MKFTDLTRLVGLRTVAASLAIAASLLAHHQATAQTLISAYQPGVTQDGAVYFLPKTAIRVTVRSVKTTYTPGDFAKYAQRYLRLNNVPVEPSVTYKVLSVSMTPVGVADTTKAYAVKFDARTVAANVALAEDGCLLAINADPRQAAAPQPFVPAPRQPQPNPRQFMTEEILAAGSTAKMAELTAQEIYDIRENKSLLIKGQADFMPKDGEQLKLMLAQLNQQDAALSSLFAGTTVNDTTEQVLMITPDRPAERQLLFRFSTRRGVVDTDDLSGTPYYISIEKLSNVPTLDAEAAAKKKKSEKGIYVNVPSRLRATVYNGNGAIVSEDFPAPQFGHTELLSEDLFNKRYATRLWLNPVSGAVDRLEAEQPKK